MRPFTGLLKDTDLKSLKGTIMHVERIVQIIAEDLFDICELVSTIPEDVRTFSLKQLSDYLIVYGSGLGMFVLVDDANKIIGLILAERPHPLDPSKGYITLAVMIPGLKKTDIDPVIEAAEKWLHSGGAVRWAAASNRNLGSWKRRWKLKEFNSEKEVGRYIVLPENTDDEDSP